jgi:hypothetical protein
VPIEGMSLAKWKPGGTFMNKLNYLIAATGLLVLISCGPRDSKQLTQKQGTSAGEGTGKVSLEGQDKVYPPKMDGKTFNRASFEDVIESFMSTPDNNPSTTRHLISDYLPLKIEDKDLFAFYKVSLALYSDATYKLLINIVDGGGQKISRVRTAGTWKVEKRELQLEKGKKNDGGIDGIKAKAYADLDEAGSPALFFDFNDAIKAGVGYKVPVDKSITVMRYTPGRFDENL